MIGAILVFTAASIYARRKGIPVDEVLNWSACTCSSNADQSVDDELADDMDLRLNISYSSGSRQPLVSR